MAKLRIRSGFIYNEDNVIVGSLTDASDQDVEVSIEAGSDALQAVKKFVEDAKTGSLKAKKTYDSFKAILDKFEISHT